MSYSYSREISLEPGVHTHSRVQPFSAKDVEKLVREAEERCFTCDTFGPGSCPIHKESGEESPDDITPSR